MEEKNIPVEVQEEYLQAYLKVMNLWGLEHHSEEIENSWGTTHINICGSKDNHPLLLLHAASINSAQWYANVKAWSKHFRLITVDTLGDCGWSRPNQDLENKTQYNKWLVDLIDQLGLDKPHILGHDYGGWLAMNLAISNPEILDKMVLLAPAASIIPLNLSTKINWKMSALPFISPLSKTSRLISKNDLVEKEFLELLDAAKRSCKSKILYPSVFSDLELLNISNPTLLLIGDQDKMYSPLKAVNRAREFIPNLKSEIIINTGHFLNLEQPEVVNSKVINFLKSD